LTDNFDLVVKKILIELVRIIGNTSFQSQSQIFKFPLFTAAEYLNDPEANQNRDVEEPASNIFAAAADQLIRNFWLEGAASAGTRPKRPPDNSLTIGIVTGGIRQQ
jgi:hypothetical protein